MVNPAESTQRKYRSSAQGKNWQKLNSEQVNTHRIVQQLKGHLKDLDELRSQVRLEDLHRFDAEVEVTKATVLKATDDYGTVESAVRKPQDDSTASTEFEELTISEQSVLIPDKTALESWEELRKELVELSEMVRYLSHCARNQRAVVEKIEEHVDHAQLTVQSGQRNMSAAARYSQYVLPVAGAVVGAVAGGVIGGPIGAFVGLKVALVTATTAGTAGAVGGAVIGYKKRQSIINKTT
eukprot:Em0277g1a